MQSNQMELVDLNYSLEFLRESVVFYCNILLHLQPYKKEVERYVSTERIYSKWIAMEEVWEVLKVKK